MASETVETQTKSRRDPKALSSEYHKAHKQLMLWATILLIWELIGVDLSKAKDAGGNIGPIVTALKSPQAVPWALTGMIIYFLFKCSVEWAQCPIDRRKIRFARIDFFSAWLVAVAAIALYVAQAISRVQFADRLQFTALLALLVAMTLVGLFMKGIARLVESAVRGWRHVRPNQWRIGLAEVIFSAGTIAVKKLTNSSITLRWLVVIWLAVVVEIIALNHQVWLQRGKRILKTIREF
jgi:hypothetical protein